MFLTHYQEPEGMFGGHEIMIILFLGLTFFLIYTLIIYKLGYYKGLSKNLKDKNIN